MNSTSNPRTQTAPELVRARPTVPTTDPDGVASQRREDTAANWRRTFLEALLRALSVGSS